MRRTDGEVVVESVDVPAHKPDGPLSAALIASGVGTLVLGLMTTLAEASDGLREHLNFDDGVGPLSGKTIYATIAFFVAWVILSIMLRQRDGLLRQATIIFLVLTGLGFLGTFPTFFQAFAE